MFVWCQCDDGAEKSAASTSTPFLPCPPSRVAQSLSAPSRLCVAVVTHCSPAAATLCLRPVGAVPLRCGPLPPPPFSSNGAYFLHTNRCITTWAAAAIWYLNSKGRGSVQDPTIIPSYPLNSLDDSFSRLSPFVVPDEWSCPTTSDTVTMECTAKRRRLFTSRTPALNLTTS